MAALLDIDLVSIRILPVLLSVLCLKMFISTSIITRLAVLANG